MSIKETPEQKELRKVEAQLVMLRDSKQSIGEEIQKCEQRKQKLENQVFKQGLSELQVTDHAVVRYIERFYQLDLEGIKKEIVADVEKFDGALKNGAGRIKTDKLSYVIKENKIITIL